ncbi:MAG: hypothetical protein N4A50_13260 [Vallitalea sp.]|jgi:DNA-binding ferritin-like protein (Dps family)/uncharacterized integral membrane protein|nr:hypothetical protein [Vallitalea sp.]
MLINEVTLLKKENEEQSKELIETDKLEINNIMKSMSIFRVNSYDAQVIRRDLIGMAQELKLRDSSFEEAIGEDVKGFANEIISNSSGPSKSEILLKFLIKLFGFLFMSYTVLAFGAFGELTWDANPVLHLLYIGSVLIIFSTEEIITPLFITEKGIKKRLPSIISILLFIVLGILIYFLNDKGYTQKVHGGYIIIISAISYLVTKYLSIKNINRMAKDKKNYIEDLIGHCKGL